RTKINGALICMVLSYYLYKYPYKLVWHIFKFLNKNPTAVAYCADPLDYVVLEPVLKYLPRISIVVKNSKTTRYLKKKGKPYKRMPCFPRAVIMSRHATHKFPEQKIIKIGFRHGAFHFKTLANARYYNDFDLYFMTSEREVEQAKARGIVTARAIGFPKLDPISNTSLDRTMIDAVKRQANFDHKKKTVIFTATWDKSGMSAIDRWIDTIDDLSQFYNILVTVHPWTSRKYLKKLRIIDSVFFIEDPNVLPYLVIADVLVGDTSSIIAEFCALDKPIITFKVVETKRTVPEITRLLKDISIQIENVDQLKDAIEYSLNNPEKKSEERQQARRMIFDKLDGQAGRRAAEIIKEKIPFLKDKSD
ncbi:MAG: CDP-glycerol glycerophosphotransferase family protein, partial [bacterium]